MRVSQERNRVSYIAMASPTSGSCLVPQVPLTATHRYGARDTAHPRGGEHEPPLLCASRVFLFLGIPAPAYSREAVKLDLPSHNPSLKEGQERQERELDTAIAVSYRTRR